MTESQTVTRMPFVVLNVKAPAITSIRKPLYTFLEKKYNKNVAEEYSQKLSDISENRKSLMNVQQASQGGLQGCINHAANMTYINAHFPISAGTGMHRVGLKFPWMDSFAQKKNVKYEQNNVYFELASSLFNAAIIESQMAAKEERKDTNSKKKALRHLARAAGLFQYILEEINPKIVQSMSLDLSPTALNGLYHVMIAQGNQIWFELAQEHNKQVETLKLLANTVQKSFNTAYGKLQEIESTASNLFAHVQFSKFFWKLMTFYLAGKQLMEIDANIDKPDYGLAINYFRMALGNVGALQQLSLSSEQDNAMQNIYSEIYYDLKPSAEKKNEVWKQAVDGNYPDMTVVDRFKQEDMSNWIKEATVDDPFSKLYPIHIMEAKSNYENSRADKISRAVRMAREHRDHIQSSLTQMGLPGSLLNSDSSSQSGFPESVHQSISKIKNMGGYNDLQQLFQQLLDLASNTNQEVQYIDRLLKDEAAQDTKFRQQYGQLWTPKPSHECVQGYLKHLHELNGKLQTSASTDTKTKATINQYENVWRSFSLSPQELDQRLPNSKASLDEEKSTLTQELQSKYDTMMEYFSKEDGIIDKLKSTAAKEDIENEFLKSPERCTEISNKRLEVYDNALKMLESISVQEDDLINQIQPLNERFQQSTDNSSLSRERQHIISSTVDGINRFNNVHASISEGIEFYSAMQENLMSMKQSVADFKYAREKEQQEIMPRFNGRPQYQHGVQISHSHQQNQHAMMNDLNSQFRRPPQ